MKSLRSKIVIIVSLVLFFTTLLLTTYSMLNTNRLFVQPISVAYTTRIDGNISNSKASITEQPSQIIGVAPNSDISSAVVTFDAVKAQKKFGISQITTMFIIVFLAIFIVYYMVGKMLKPLNELNKATMVIDENNLNTEIKVPKTQDEISKLAKSFNSMLDRLSSSFKVQKDFTQNAAHEFKTPLAIIKSSLQVLELDEKPTIEDYEENAKIIGETVDELINIVSQLLMLSDKGNIEKEYIELKNLIEECLLEQKEYIDKMNINILKSIENISIYSNVMIVKSIISNILNNGIKYNKIDGTLNIELKKTDTYTELIISDTGIGINEEELSHIFEPFFRVDKSRNKAIEGNGLGLSIVKTGLEKIGGDIYIESAIDMGTKVTIKI